MSLTVFVSSTIDNLTDERQAARDSITALGLTPVMAEHDLPAQSTTPRNACLSAVQAADIYLGILGPSYGYVSPELGKSATELEFEEALRLGKPIIWMFHDCDRDEQQAAFSKRIGEFDNGFFRRTFGDTTQLATEIVHALRNHAEQVQSGNSIMASWRTSVQEIVAGDPFSRMSGTMVVACAPCTGNTTLDLLGLDEEANCEFIEQLLLFGKPPLISRQYGLERNKLSDSVEFNEANSDRSREPVSARIWPSCQILTKHPVQADALGVHDFFSTHIIDERKICSGIEAAIGLSRCVAGKFSDTKDLVVDVVLIGCSERYIGVPRQRQSMNIPIAPAGLGNLIYCHDDSTLLRERDDVATFAERSMRLYKRKYESAGLNDRGS